MTPRLLFVLLAVAALTGCATGGNQTTTSTTTAPTTSTPATTTGQTPTITSVTVGTEAAYPPFEDLTPGGDIVGFDVDVMQEIANRSHFTVKFQNAQFTAIIPSIQSKQFDAGISAFTITDERKQQVDFSVPYYNNDLMVAVRSAETSITKEDDLKAHKVCTQTGTTSETWLLDHGQPNASILRFDSFPPCADALKRGDVDAMMIDRAVVREQIGKSSGALKEAFTITTEEQFGIAVSKERKDLLTLVNAALVTMKSDGTMQRLMDKWQV